VLIDLGKYEKALELLDAASMEDPRNVDVYLLKGRVYLSMGRLAEANDVFGDAVAVDGASGAQKVDTTILRHYRAALQEMEVNGDGSLAGRLDRPLQSLTLMNSDSEKLEALELTLDFLMDREAVDPSAYRTATRFFKAELEGETEVFESRLLSAIQRLMKTSATVEDHQDAARQLANGVDSDEGRARLEKIAAKFGTDDSISPADYFAANNGNGVVLLVGGELAGHELSPTDWSIAVGRGRPIAGSLRIEADNFMGSNAVAPFGFTWTWGDRRSSVRVVRRSIRSGVSTLDVPLDLRAPSEPGTYYILFAFNGEFTGEQVFSCHSWAAEDGVTWYDGNDYHDMTDSEINFAHKRGFVNAWKYRTANGYRDADVPMMPIRVVVE
jgi:hypothetical protein